MYFHFLQEYHVVENEKSVCYSKKIKIKIKSIEQFENNDNHLSCFG